MSKRVYYCAVCKEELLQEYRKLGICRSCLDTFEGEFEEDLDTILSIPYKEQES